MAALACPLLPRAATAQSMDRSFAIDHQGRGSGEAFERRRPDATIIWIDGASHTRD